MTDLVVRPETAPAVMDTRQLEYIAGTDFIPKGLRGNLPAIMACVQTGRALGLPDMAALRSIHIVDGKATFSAELMVSLVRRAGHSITGETGDGVATVRGRRGDNGDEMTVTWTLAMAERAGLKGKQNWQRYPEAMLWARAVSQLCRMLFADVFIGATYTPEEIGEQHTDPDGIPVEDDGLFPPLDHETGQPVEAGSDPPATDAQTRKLNVLVGTLRDLGAVTTAEVYEYAGRPIPEGELHWSPLRDSLTKREASGLIETLQQLEESLPAPMSLPDLAATVSERGWADQQLAAVAARLFPNAQTAADLSDRQRGILAAKAQAELG